MSNISRRSFLQRGTAAAAALTIAPSSILGKSHGYVAPTDKLNVAAVGIGGMGHANINNVKKSGEAISLLFVTLTGNTQTVYSKKTQMLRNIGTTARCMTNAQKNLTLLSSQLQTTLTQ